MGSLAIGVATATWAADLNDDGMVDAADQSVLLASWGECPAPCPSDLDGDGAVDGVDLAILLDAAAATEDGGTSDTVETEGLYVQTDGSESLKDKSTFGTEDPILSPVDQDLDIAIHNVPLPAPVWMGLAGLAGAFIVRRRWFGSFA